MRKILTKILIWWNNLPFCQRKKQEWLQERAKANYKEGLLKELHWPEDVKHEHKSDFKDSDWIYKPGDRCEHWVCWFFGPRTMRCTITEKDYCYQKVDSSFGYWVSAYQFKEDWGDAHNFDLQSTLSY